MGRSSCGTCMIVSATILGPVVMVLLAVSFATDHWQDFQVKEGSLGAYRTLRDSNPVLARYTHDRNRGFWRECYSGNDTIFLENLANYEPELIDKYCFFVKYNIPEERNNNDWSNDYLSRIHLLRCWMAFFIVALVVFLVAYIFGLVLCCWRQSKWAYIAGLCAYIAAFSTAASIAFFHGAEYLERNKILDEDPYTGKFWYNWPSEVQSATDREYGYSYIIGWLAMFFAALTATFYSIAGCYIGEERYQDRDYYDKHSRSHEYLDRSYPMPLEPPYKEQYYGYPQQGPYLYDMDARQPLPAIQYGPEPAAYRWG
ncbi:transmembrane protein 178B-like isoform X2 [Mya arenaria]|uniref:transmembrane protein 178B-like isoform X2 n=1 Tax=Mya arenaria TaxID=6604 RepID=UPI0022E8E929|nr:transmembrane protein 178B-like isoform X2 [Mya arenaria]